MTDTATTPKPRDRTPKYPWGALQVGQSFIHPAISAPRQTGSMGRHYGVKFSARKTREG